MREYLEGGQAFIHNEEHCKIARQEVRLELRVQGGKHETPC